MTSIKPDYYMRLNNIFMKEYKEELGRDVFAKPPEELIKEEGGLEFLILILAKNYVFWDKREPVINRSLRAAQAGNLLRMAKAKMCLHGKLSMMQLANQYDVLGKVQLKIKELN